MVLCALSLLCVGVLMVNSAGLAVARVDSAQDVVPAMTVMSIVKSRSALYMAMAVVAMAVGSVLPVRRFAVVMTNRATGSMVFPIMAMAVVVILAFCALVYVPGVRDVRNGAHRWISLGFSGAKDLSMQPSEVAKWAFVPLIAWYCAVRAEALPKLFRGLLPAMIAVAVVAGFVVLEDLGTGVLIGAVACLLLLAGGARFWHFALPGLVAGGGVAAAILTSEYRMNRVKAFLDPYANPETIGYHTIQGLIAIHKGEGFGRGLGEGLQKRGYLPEVTTDYIMPVICEEGGIAGAAFVMALLLGLVWAGVAIARRERDPMLRLWSLGVAATIGLQATINLLVVTGLAPAKGIALPLISSGGTGWILTAFSLGMLVAIERTADCAAEQESSTHPVPVSA